MCMICTRRIVNIPSRDTCVDRAINVQSFVLNVFWRLDILASGCVIEKSILGRNDRPLKGIQIGINKDPVKASFERL